MSGLTATFKLVDEMSDKFANIASGGQDMLSKFEEMGNIADNFFSQLNEGSESAAKAVEEVSLSFKGYENSINSVASSVGNWTDEVGNYSKSMLEAVYTTEELVDMGFKTADALIEEGEMLGICETSAASLNKEIEFSIDAQTELNAVIESASDVLKEVSENENLSAETKRELASASEYAAQAIQELEAAKIAAKEAMDSYDNTIISGTTDIKQLNEAAETAKQAAENLSVANKKAGQATEELGKASKEAAEECEKAGKNGSNAFENMAETLAAAGIVALIKDISSAAYELADAFSEAQSTVVKATGAAGDALDELNVSMMNAYATAKAGSSLDDVSGAIGEINTRMALTGDALTDVTGQFLDFSNITGTDVVGSVQNVTKVMNRWGVDIENVESVLDKLSYAGQVSGISVNTLASNLISGAAIFQEAGMSLDNTVSMLADFELAGINGATAITAMRTAVKNFSEDGLDAEMVLQVVVSEIANAGSAAEANAIAMDTFGKKAGIDMANAIKNGIITVDSFTGTLDKASGTLEKTAENSQTLGQKWQQASNNIKTAFTTALQPTLDKASSKFAEFVNGIGDYLNEHPTVVKAVTAIGVGLGVVAAGISGVAFSVKIVQPLIVELGSTFNTALGPIGWFALAITGITAAIGFFCETTSEAKDELFGMTESTKEQYYELQNLNKEYERACDEHGLLSDEASKLKYKVDTLTESYESNKRTVEEFNAEIEELGKEIEENAKRHKEAMNEIDNNGASTFALINRLEQLSLSTKGSSEAQKEMEAIIKKLNGSVDGLNLSYSDLQKNQKGIIPDVKEFAKKVMEQKKIEEMVNSYSKSYENFESAKEKKERAVRDAELAKSKYELEQANYEWAISEAKGKAVNGMAAPVMSTERNNARDRYEEALKTQEAAQTQYMLAEAQMNAMESQLDNHRKAAEEAEYAVINYGESIAKMTSNVRTKMEELVDQYQKVYEAARSSLDSQHDLFEKIEVKAGMSSSKIIEIMKQQEEIFSTYNENLKKLENYNINTGFLKELSDGSVESMGKVKQLVNELNGLSSAKAAEVVNNINENFAKLSAAKDKTATTMAEIQDDWKAKLNDMYEELETTIEKMKMDKTSEEAAKKTMEGYIKGINSMKSSAVNAATAVAAAASNALNRGSINLASTSLSSVFSSLQHNAKGTIDSDNVFIAGEEGPELVVGAGGSTVFPADHTERIINAINRKPLQTEVPEYFQARGEQKNYNYNETKSEKKITLEINGRGSLNMGNSFDEENAVHFLYDNIKPVLINMINSEIYEEGDASYGY